VTDAVGIVCHPRIDIGQEPVVEARARLERHGFRVWTYCSTAEERPGALDANLEGTRLIVSIGGDGTLLWTAEQASAAAIPVLGVNAGRLGFLTEVRLADAGPALDRWVAGDFILQRRAMLEARFSDRTYVALNDIVVHKGIEFNLIRIEVSVDGEDAGRFDADGAIVSTATGSTGYALSLGGPILHPDVRALTYLPLNPHSLFNRAVVIPEQSHITVRLPDASGLLTCDGQRTATLAPGAQVEIFSPGGVDLVRFRGDQNFFTLPAPEDPLGSPAHGRQPVILELTVRNLALIDELRVPFKPGLNLLTGETGSGKSIIIDAMNLVLGERASSDMIREGLGAGVFGGGLRPRRPAGRCARRWRRPGTSAATACSS